MLQHYSCPVISDPSSANRLGKRDAERCAQNKYGITEREGQRVSRDHSREREVERLPAGLNRSDVGPHGKYEQGDPKECEESLQRTYSRQPISMIVR